MLPKLEEFSVDELKKQLDNKKIDKEFLIEYVVKRDKVYNKLIDEVNRLRIEVISKEEYTSVYLKGCTDIKGKYLSQQKEFIKYLEDEIWKNWNLSREEKRKILKQIRGGKDDKNR